MGTLYKDHYTFMIICRSVLLRMRNISYKCRANNQDEHFMSNNFFSPPKSCLCETKWKNIVEPDRPLKTIWRMCIACWIPNVTNTHADCVIQIAFPLQKMFARKRLNVTFYVYVHNNWKDRPTRM